METTIIRTKNGNAVLENFNEYACGNYNEGNPQSNNNVQVGELVLDQENKLGVVLAIYSDGDIRCNSNGVCNDTEITKLPYELAVEMFNKQRWGKIRTL